MWLGAASTSGVRLSSAGMSTHMVVDQFGWFTGVPPAPTLGAAANISTKTAGRFALEMGP